jgi:hypothetical protein
MNALFWSKSQRSTDLFRPGRTSFISSPIAINTAMNWACPGALPPALINSLSSAESSRVLQRLAREILNEDFSLVPREADFELWSHKREVEGYRHCVYLEPNYCSTLAVLVTFALPAKIIAGGFGGENALRRLMVTPKQVFFSSGRPLLWPMTTPPSNAYMQVRTDLNEHLERHPPHLLPR